MRSAACGSFRSRLLNLTRYARVPNAEPGACKPVVVLRLERCMRDDMAKVIVERPRKKGCSSKKPKGYLRRLRSYGEDGPPSREGIKARWQGRTKYLNEHLGPLRRYLDRQVGRP